MQYTSKAVYEFISRQTNDPIIERKTCVISGQMFPIYQSDVDFYTKISPTLTGQRFQIPTPTICPEERQRRRLSFMNQTKIYKNKCCFCGSSIISRFHSDSGIKVYCNDCWASDGWDMCDYGIDFNPTLSVTEHVRVLIYSTPFQNLIGSFSNLDHNAQYTNYTADIVDSYMIFEGDFLQYSMYGTSVKQSSYLIDCDHGLKSDYCYECIDFSKCYNLYYSSNCDSCRDSVLLSDCHSCDHCIACVNLVGKSYYYLNQPIDQAKYEELRVLFFGKGREEIVASFEQLVRHGVKSATVSYGSDQCEGSNQCLSSSRCMCVNTVFDCQDGKYSSSMNTAQDFMDIDYYGSHSSLLYEGLAVGRYSRNLLFCNTIGRGEDLLYCIDVKKSRNCFGCVNMKDKQYCIFNKQYTKEEYEEQVAKIIAHMQDTGEWGEFFHPSLSPFGYNETVAQEYYPVIVTDDGQMIDQKIYSEDVKSSGKSSESSSANLQMQGYRRSTYSSDPKIPSGAQVLEKKDFTQEQRNHLLTNDEILKKIIICEVSGRPYMIQKSELEFYRIHGLTIPSKHPDIRHEERMKLRAGKSLCVRECDCCHQETLSVYPKAYNGKVYCESCYQKEIFG